MRLITGFQITDILLAQPQVHRLYRALDMPLFRCAHDRSRQGGVVARQLMAPFRECLYASSAYLEAFGIPVSPADLSRHRLIGYRFITNNRILPLILEENGGQLTLDMQGQLISNDIDVMADGIRSGLGIGRLFEPVYQLQADKDRFIPVMEPYWKTYPPVFLYYPKSAGKTKRVQSLIEFLILKNTK